MLQLMALGHALPAGAGRYRHAPEHRRRHLPMPYRR